MRSFAKKPSKLITQCQGCGLSVDHCICNYEISLKSICEIWLLTHENEFSRTTNTGRLIEKALASTRVFSWNRTEPPQDLIALLQDQKYKILLVFSDERPSEKARSVSFEKTERIPVFLILDGTWKEARKMLRKSPYLDALPILSLDTHFQTTYDLRRNDDENHICTAEVAVSLLDLVGEKEESRVLNQYYKCFLESYHLSQK
ncbi:MAG: DTW domain-containing protein [Clostridia bacterium]|nr:DTW domain-containing protein [Clostridia bacterium]